jgi:hypothetical protein
MIHSAAAESLARCRPCHPRAPSSPIGTSGVQSALIVDGLELSRTKPDELNALGEERQRAADPVPLPCEIAM